jgi:undecaprenyl phosphate-alpha-L-ara4FN deformylase
MGRPVHDHGMKVGLRIDIDTFRGTREGMPNLNRLLQAHNLRASCFFSVGPDNMGRHLWRLLRPAFLLKMLRTRAASLYGWDILLRGTLWPGPLIGRRLGWIIRASAEAGHEIGFHAWDHRAWQAHIDTMTAEEVHQVLQRGVDCLTEITGHPPTCSAVPSWKCNNLVLLEKARFPFTYNSDCRGHSIFYPHVDGQKLSQPQVPVTLPTYDEVIGQRGISDRNYTEYLLSLLHPDRLNVLTIHAEVEGLSRHAIFEDFLRSARFRGCVFVPLRDLIPAPAPTQEGVISPQTIPGREGWVAVQAPLLSGSVRGA